MPLSIHHEHLVRAVRLLDDKFVFRKFLAEIREECPSLFDRIGKICGEFVEHCKIDPDDPFQEQYKQVTIHSVLLQVCWVLGTLRIANGDRVPTDVVVIYDAIKNDSVSEQKVIEERLAYLATINSNWVNAAIYGAYGARLCDHVTGPIYALAEAFLEAKKREEEKEMFAKGLSDDVRRRTIDLKRGTDVVRFIEGLELDL